MHRYELRRQAEEPSEALALAECEEPRPSHGEVLVRLHAASLNFRDLLIAAGRYGGPQPLPIVPLSDGAGEVVDVGPGVDRLKPGDRVAGIFFQRWIDGPLPAAAAASALGGAIHGLLAQYAVLHQEGLVLLPEHLSYEEAATLPCAAVTAWNALVEAGPALRAGETVLLLGTGGVSVFALQFAKMMGARVIITSSSDEKLQRAQALGADLTINYRQHPDWEQEVRRLTDGRGVDRVIEVGGAGTLPRSIASLALGGRASFIGVMTGIQNREGFDFAPVLLHNLHLDGIYVGSRAMFERMNQAIAANRMKPVIDRVFPFEAALEAYRHLKSGEHFGKVVISMPR